MSPGWATEVQRLWGGKSDIPIADAKPEEIKDLLGGALFKALYKWMEDSGPVYLLPTGTSCRRHWTASWFGGSEAAVLC